MVSVDVDEEGFQLMPGKGDVNPGVLWYDLGESNIYILSCVSSTYVCYVDIVHVVTWYPT